MPTHAPTGSTSEFVDLTATLVRTPPSRAMPTICTVPSTISGTSWRKSSMINCGVLRERTIRGPRAVFSTLTIMTFRRSLKRYLLPIGCSESGSTPSVLPMFSTTSRRSKRCTMPVTT